MATARSEHQKKASEGYSRTGERRTMDKSGQQKKVNKRGALTDWRAQSDRQFRRAKGTDKLGQQEKVSKRGVLTNWRAQRCGQVRMAKKTEQARRTHILEGTEGWASQCTKRKRVKAMRAGNKKGWTDVILC